MSSHELAIKVDEAELFDGAPTPANGDPYVAVIMKLNEHGSTTKSKSLTLGTGYESIDDIAHQLRRILTNPDHFSYDIDFIPDEAHIFGISGHVEFALEDDIFTVEVEDETHFVEARDELDAKYRAATKFKQAMDGPEVGLGVEELAQSATVVDGPAEPASA